MLASSNSEGSFADLARLVEGYRLCARSEGKSQNTIDIVTRSLYYFLDFLRLNSYSTDVADIGATEIRAFILYLQSKRCFSNHPFSRPQDRGLSSHSVNCYLRSIRAFWSWLCSEEFIQTNPFAKVKIPKVLRKIIPTFTENQLRALLAVIDRHSAEGYRDYAIIVTLLDTALRVSELTGIRMADLSFDEGLVRVMGKGGRERLIPLGREARRIVWQYLNRYRPGPRNQNSDFPFLNRDGRVMTKNRIETFMKRYGGKAGITGVRCSPHTLRHTAAVMFLRNGGNVFSLQRLLGHSSLEMTRHYCELADIDVIKAHLTASPVDSLGSIASRLRKTGRS